MCLLCLLWFLLSFTEEPKTDHTACCGPDPAHTELRTAYKPVAPEIRASYNPVRLAERTAVEAALRAPVEAGQAEVRFPQDALLHQTATG
jgi:hypothetical protein